MHSSMNWGKFIFGLESPFNALLVAIPQSTCITQQVKYVSTEYLIFQLVTIIWIVFVVLMDGVHVFVFLLVAHYQFGAVFPSDVELQSINRVCMYRSHWSHNRQSYYVNYTPSCSVSCFFMNYIAVNCGTPSFLSNGQRHYSGTTFGYTVTYTCNTGYLRTAGSSSRTCQSNGVWSGSHPTCTHK